MDYLLISLSWVGAPHHFLLQRVEEGASLLLYHASGIGCFAQRECGMLGIAVADAIDGYQKTAIAAFDGEMQGLVIGNDDGTEQNSHI